MKPGQRAVLAALQAQTENAPTLRMEPVTVARVDGTDVYVTWRTTECQVAYPDHLTLEAGQTVLLVIVPGGTPFIGWRLTGI